MILFFEGLTMKLHEATAVVLLNAENRTLSNFRFTSVDKPAIRSIFFKSIIQSHLA